MKRLFKQFSFPGGIPSHVAPETPGSIHEGGELGYSLSHAYGAAFDNPDLLVACVVGDGEAETGAARHELALEQVPQSGARRRRAADPASERLQDRRPDGAGAHSARRAGSAVSRLRLHAVFRRGRRPDGDAPADGRDARRGRRRDPAHPDATPARTGSRQRPRWPMIVLRSPKGWTGPKVVDGKPTEGTFRSHQVPMGDMSHPGHVKLLEEWMKSYRPQELFDETGRLRPELAELAPEGERRMSANPHANGGLLLRDLRLPDFRDYAVEGAEARGRGRRSHARSGPVHPRRDEAEPDELPRLQPGRNDLEPLGRRVRGDEPLLDRGDRSRRRPRRARRPRDGDAERASVPGLARRLSAHRPPRLLLLLRGVHPHRRFDVQPARQVAEGDAATFPGAGRSPR